MKACCGLILFSILLAVQASDFATELQKHCDEVCDPGKCAEIEASLRQTCKTGLIMDMCDCCLTCGGAEGGQCDVDVINDPVSFNRAIFVPKFGRCGPGLRCVVDESPEARHDRAFCLCEDGRPVCGSDGRTYANPCRFHALTFGRANPPSIAQHQPCKEAPQIVAGPGDAELKIGGEVILTCEASGFPLPRIDWEFTATDGEVITMPSMKKAIQSRGGPGKIEITGWLSMQEAEAEDSGTYTCIARNELGEAKASARIIIS